MNVGSLGDGATGHYDGERVEHLAEVLDLPLVVAFEHVTSTLDVAHALGARGAPAGTLVLADAQTAGRGRMGRVWQSASGAGVWLTVLERPEGAEVPSVLSVRLALGLALALDRFAHTPIALKWPNDLHLRGRKLGGVLIEARWRGGRLDWLAAGVGINVRLPDGVQGAALDRPGHRLAVLRAIVPAIREAVAASGPLSPKECAAFTDRDVARGRACQAPVQGVVFGIDDTGALLVDTPNGRVAAHGGSLVLCDTRAPAEDVPG